jgi:hypothetical protein
MWNSGGVRMCFLTVQRWAVFRMALRYLSGKPAGGVMTISMGV